MTAHDHHSHRTGASGQATAIDPVCGMTVVKEGALHTSGRTCSLPLFTTLPAFP